MLYEVITMGQLLGAALTYRAIYYADLMKAWGDVPARFEPITSETLYIAKSSRDDRNNFVQHTLYEVIRDLIVALKGTAVLAEFPELCGVEQELANRCVDNEKANKFLELMKAYEKSVVDAGSGFDMNPSPGNIKDGLITDAMKSAGAAKKGGTSPVVDVLDYGEYLSSYNFV